MLVLQNFRSRDKIIGAGPLPEEDLLFNVRCPFFVFCDILYRYSLSKFGIELLHYYIMQLYSLLLKRTQVRYHISKSAPCLCAQQTHNREQTINITMVANFNWISVVQRPYLPSWLAALQKVNVGTETIGTNKLLHDRWRASSEPSVLSSGTVWLLYDPRHTSSTRLPLMIFLPTMQNNWLCSKNPRRNSFNYLHLAVKSFLYRQNLLWFSSWPYPISHFASSSTTASSQLIETESWVSHSFTVSDTILLQGHFIVADCTAFFYWQLTPCL